MTVRIAATFAIVASLALPVWAQEADAPIDPNLPPPVSLSYVDGEVQALTQGAADRAEAPSMLIEGDGVRTARGRAELVFGDGSVLHLAEDTAVDLLGDRRLRVLSGRVVFRASPAADDGYVIDTPAASIHAESRGEYSLVVDDGRRGVDLSVARGGAEIELAAERVVIRPGEQARLDGPGDRPLVRAYNSARLDAFERWALTRYDGETLSASSRRLPVELRAYGDSFDRYGRWDTVEPYGQVWYPSVGSDWRPYYNGGWRRTRYGMTWYGNDPWSWPTHHYGRWQSNGAFWFWVPARVWGPAWVSWAYAPGYVSWAPLGWNSRPVVPFYLRVGAVNPDRWRAWTVIPRGYLGSRGLVRPWVVDGRRLPGTFIERPLPRATVYAARRDAGIGRSPSSINRVVPRGSYTDRNGVTRPGPATTPSGRTYGGGDRRNPYPSTSRGTARGGDPGNDGSARPGSRQRVEPQDAGRPAATPPASPSPGAIRRGETPSYAPADRDRGSQGRARGESRPVDGGGERTGSTGAERRAPRSERPEPSAASPAPRAEGARTRGGSGASGGGGDRGASEGRARDGDSGGGNRGSDGSSGTRSGSARRPPGH